MLADASIAQEPILRISYSRTAYQDSTSNALRVTIDEEVGMRPDSLQGLHSRGSAWCETPSGDTAREQRFPYAILEFTTDSQAASPLKEAALMAELQRLQEDGMLLRMSEFSKFKHAVALLFGGHPGILASPPWFVVDRGCRTPCIRPGTYAELSQASEPHTVDEEGSDPFQKPPLISVGEDGTRIAPPMPQGTAPSPRSRPSFGGTHRGNIPEQGDRSPGHHPAEEQAKEAKQAQSPANGAAIHLPQLSSAAVLEHRPTKVEKPPSPPPPPPPGVGWCHKVNLPWLALTSTRCPAALWLRHFCQVFAVLSSVVNADRGMLHCCRDPWAQ